MSHTSHSTLSSVAPIAPVPIDCETIATKPTSQRAISGSSSSPTGSNRANRAVSFSLSAVRELVRFAHTKRSGKVRNRRRATTHIRFVRVVRASDELSRPRNNSYAHNVSHSTHFDQKNLRQHA